MSSIKRILCVCIGNSDRSPAMAAVLALFLKSAGHEVVVESAGVGESAEKGGPAGPYGIAAAKRIGLDISSHIRRRVTQIDLSQFDLFVCATDEIVALLLEQGVPLSKIYNVDVKDPWPVHFQQDYDPTFDKILVAMYRVISRYFSN